MTNFGMKISAPGVDVGTATDDRDLYFSSKFNYLKQVIVGTTSIIVPGTATSSQNYSGTIAHNLGYAPVTDVYVNDGTISAHNSLEQVAFAARLSLIDRCDYDYQVGTTNLIIRLRTDDPGFWPPGSDQTFLFRYYIFINALE